MKRQFFTPEEYKLFTKEEIRQFALDEGIKDSAVSIGKWEASKGFKKKMKNGITYYINPLNERYYAQKI